MSISHSISINCSTTAIFAIYKDIDSWVQWDKDLEAIALDGEFAVGSTGWLKPVGAPKTRTVIVSISEPVSFAVESRLPFCTMCFNHLLEQTDASNTLVTHSVEFKGMMAPVFSMIVGKKIKNTIVDSMQGLKEFAERQSS